MADMDRSWNKATIDDHLGRARWATYVAHYGKRPKDDPNSPGTKVEMADRTIFAQAAQANALIALAMQNERDYEERQAEKIVTKLTEEVKDAEVQADGDN
jgi:hypothetical protein